MNTIKSIKQWNTILQKAQQELVIIFKHSNRCPISAAALKRVQEGIENQQITTDVWLVTVQTHREISNAIAEDLGVIHETPQIILLKDGRAVYHASHEDVQVAAIAAEL